MINFTKQLIYFLYLSGFKRILILMEAGESRRIDFIGDCMLLLINMFSLSITIFTLIKWMI